MCTLLVYKLIIEVQGVKANERCTERPKANKEKNILKFFLKTEAWLSSPKPKSHNVLIGSQRATTPTTRKYKNTKTQ